MAPFPKAEIVMCGIAGAIGPEPVAQPRLERALRTMGRRGPDAQGFHATRLGPWHVSLLHTRLAIIDLDPRSNQPFEKDGLVLVFNGEIYNYVEIRRDLEALGVRFRTDSDTEVLVESWRVWGEQAFDRFEGMWAFALIDSLRGTLILSRDRFGEKPLYLWRNGGTLYFASEIKTLAALAGQKPDVNDDQIARYLVNGYKVLFKRGETHFVGVKEFPAGAFALIDHPALPDTRAYWHLRYAPDDAMSREEALEGTRDRLVEAMRLRMRADVPLAFCLSGGIDSSTLTALAAKRFGQRLHCFSVIDRDERYDESENIACMVDALQCRHFKVRTSYDGFFERMEDLVAYHDAPVVTISYYVHSFLSQAIAEHGYKVAVSGTAADEIFTGYYDHYSMWLAEMKALSATDPGIDFERLVADWRGGYGATVRNPLLQDPLAFAINPDQRSHILLNADLFRTFLDRPFDEPWTEKPFCENLLRNRMMNELFEEAVPVLLQEDDRNSMRYSIENRSPFLDRNLVEFLFTVPSRHLIRDGYAKWLLRAGGDGLVPDAVRLDKRKRGFNAAIDSVVDRDDPETRERLLSEGPIFDLVRRDAVEGFLNGNMASNSFSKFLFSFISAKLFLEHHRRWDPLECAA